MEKDYLYFNMVPKKGRISGDPTNILGQGGNFIPRKEKHKSYLMGSLRGKATSGSDILIGGRLNDFVRFRARPTVGNIRSELATGPSFDFGDEKFINFKFRVNSNDDITGTAYLLQFWQPVISPIAGIRIQNDKIQAVTRSAGGAYSQPLREGKWNTLKMAFKAGSDGHFKVYNRKGRLLGEVDGTIDGGSLAGRSLRDVWRPKFGFYGSGSNNLNVDVKRFTITDIAADIGLG